MRAHVGPWGSTHNATAKRPSSEGTGTEENDPARTSKGPALANPTAELALDNYFRRRTAGPSLGYIPPGDPGKMDL